MKCHVILTENIMSFAAFLSVHQEVNTQMSANVCVCLEMSGTEIRNRLICFFIPFLIPFLKEKKKNKKKKKKNKKKRHQHKHQVY